MSPDRRTQQRGGRPPRNTRPAQRGGTGRPPRPPSRTTVPGPGERPRFTNRAAILLVVLALLVISYASSMRAYLHQRSQISDTQSRIAQLQAENRDKKAEIERYRDPEYVKQQARSRFGWVMPGETAYQVLDENGDPVTGDDELTDPASLARKPAPRSWWSKVGASIDAADHPKKLVTKPPPAGQIGKDGTAR